MAPANIKNFEIKIGKTGVIMVVLGMSALLFGAFLFGVDVGKNIDTYPEKISAVPRQVLDFLWRPQKIHLDVDDVRINQKTQPQDDPIDLTFYNALTNKEGQEKSSLNNEPAVVGNLKKDETVVLDFNNGGKKTEETIQKDQKSQTEPVMKNDRQEKTTKQDSGEGEKPRSFPHQNAFLIQAGSLKEKKKAVELNKKVASLGYKSDVVKTEIKGKGTVYRIMVSGFSAKDQAEEASDKISKKIGTKCIIKSIKQQ